MAGGGNTGRPIGTGDSFEGGKLFPHGLGSQPNGSDLGSILSTTGIHSAFRGLAREYGFETFTTPYRTHENATIFGGNGGQNNDAYHVYLNAAIHARERGSSENLIYFVADRLYADRHG
ncbi:hypothetical protein DL768_006367 [Monosporascus sp. mg162]|nr:hypothetical protein DL768_006367 [Monosporascus sp. mg162]